MRIDFATVISGAHDRSAIVVRQIRLMPVLGERRERNCKGEDCEKEGFFHGGSPATSDCAPVAAHMPRYG
jgi:hypothetical protein